MSKLQWTPGPWITSAFARSIDVRGSVCKEFEGIEYRPLVVSLQGYHDWTECTANANLIAAAPDMYEALRGLLRYIPAADLIGQTVRQSDHFRAALKAHEAIAKARGEK